MALENCSTVNDVEKFLQATVRDGGMVLFAVDGKTNAYAVYECTCRSYVKRQSALPYIAAGNHYSVSTVPAGFRNDPGSARRQRRMEELLASLKKEDPVRELSAILSDREVEQNLGVSGTVYANLACPSKDVYYYACNGFPAASGAAFEEVVLT